MSNKDQNSSSLNIDQMSIKQLRDTVKALTMLMTFEADRITALQERVLALEVKALQEEKKECDHIWSVDLNGRHIPQCMKCMEHPKLTIEEGKVDK